MYLFSKDKEIIFKITNAILLIWLIGATVVFSSSIIELVLKEPSRNYTYEQYKIANCKYYMEDKDLTDETKDQRCKLEYDNYKLSNENSDYYKYLSLYVALANMLIVGGVMFFINKKDEKVKSKK